MTKNLASKFQSATSPMELTYTADDNVAGELTFPLHMEQ